MLFDDENKKTKEYYEKGAHFSYKNLCNKLEMLIKTLPLSRREITIYPKSKSIKNLIF